MTNQPNQQKGGGDLSPSITAWFRWSMAGKPTVPVRGDGAALLDAPAIEHPVLSRLCDVFGIQTDNKRGGDNAE